MRKSYSVYIILPFLLFFVSGVSADVFYVSPNGEDSADGRSPKHAWKSLERVNSAAIQPGDSVLFRRGGVWRGTLLPKSGTPGKPVLYGAYGSEKRTGKSLKDVSGASDVSLPALYGSADGVGTEKWEEISPGLWASSLPRYETVQTLRVPLKNGWNLYCDKKAEASLEEITDSDGNTGFAVHSRRSEGTGPHIQAWGAEVSGDFQAGKTYIFRFRIRCTKPFLLDPARITLARAPWTGRLLGRDAISVTSSWQTVEYPMYVPGSSSGKVPGSTSGENAEKEPSSVWRWHWNFGKMPSEAVCEVIPLALSEVTVSCPLELPYDVGNILLNGAESSWKRWKLEDVTHDGDFFYDDATHRVFLRRPTNPGLEKSVELTMRKNIINEGGAHDVVYENLEVALGGAHGIGGGDVKRITIRNSVFHHIGGSYFRTYEDGITKSRYGNGVEFWCSAEDCLVENCVFREIYDAAVTNQGKGSPENPSVQRRITYRGNEIRKAEYSFEYWNRDGITEDIVFEKNRCYDAGGSWAHAQRRDPNGAHLMFYSNSAPTAGFIVRENLFSCSTEVCFRFDKDWRQGLTLEKNRYIQDSARPVVRWLLKTYYSVGDWEKYVRETELDGGSCCEAEYAEP